ncbi:hypothetical protein Hypma_014515 [Hypsizygus marmoreus]|uniref:Uncharacterized protein n=1 Tax=Hypsizygus marmoreus TaxID=39966 RepID=A0A369JER6_HYPMA|nr:hypothetical protein Hypma_014515 [Hypsizygus marmoreus]
MSINSRYLIRLLLTHEPQRTDYILRDSVKQEFLAMRLHLQVMLEFLNISIHAAHLHQPLQGLLSQLELSHSASTWLVENINIAVAPHKNLPPEILSHIFVHCSQNALFFPPLHPLPLPSPFSTHKQTTPWTLMHVCSRWRQVVLKTPELWRNVTISHDPWCGISRQYWAERIEEIINPSHDILIRGTRTLKVSLVIDDYSSIIGEVDGPAVVLGHANPVRDIIAPVSRQLTSIWIDGSSDLLLRFLQSAPLPFDSLEFISLDFNSSLSHSSQHFALNDVLVLRNAPQLRRIALITNNDPDSYFTPGQLSLLHAFQLPWTQLTEIKAQDAWITPAACYAIFSQCPNLSNCEFSVSFMEPGWALDLSPYTTERVSLTHPGIHSISLQFDYPTKAVFLPEDFLRSLVLPSLQALRIVTDLRPTHTMESTLLAFICRSECSLEAFSFSWERDDDEDRNPNVHLDLHPVLLRLSPRLLSLTIYSGPISSTTLKLAVRGALLPKLICFSCEIASWECLSLFLDLAECRSTRASEPLSIIDDATVFFRPPHQTIGYGEKVTRRAKIVREVAKQEGRKFEIYGLQS